jgi:hypothetical protein
MGGVNESVLPSDKKQAERPGSILQSDFSPLPPPPMDQRQRQSIRIHRSGPEVHLHADDEKLKVAIPVAEWFTILRRLSSNEPATYSDAKNKTIARICPYVQDGIMEVNVAIQSVQIGKRLESLLNVAAQ